MPTGFFKSQIDFVPIDPWKQISKTHLHAYKRNTTHFNSVDSCSQWIPRVTDISFRQFPMIRIVTHHTVCNTYTDTNTHSHPHPSQALKQRIDKHTETDNCVDASDHTYRRKSNQEFKRWWLVERRTTKGTVQEKEMQWEDNEEGEMQRKLYPFYEDSMAVTSAVSKRQQEGKP